MSKPSARPTEIAGFLDDNAKQMLRDIDLAEGQIDEFIEIMKDRFKQSSEHGYAVTLAKMFELKTDLFSKRTNILKMLSTDRGIDVGAKKNTISAFQFTDILSGASVSGMAVQGGMPQGALPGFYEPIPQQTIDIKAEEDHSFDIVDPAEKLEFESEALGSNTHSSALEMMARVIPTEN